MRASNDKRVSHRLATKSLLLANELLKVRHPKNLGNHVHFALGRRRKYEGITTDPNSEMFAGILQFQFLANLSYGADVTTGDSFIELSPKGGEHIWIVTAEYSKRICVDNKNSRLSSREEEVLELRNISRAHAKVLGNLRQCDTARTKL